MTSAPQWRFRRMTPAEINQDPVQGEFFTSTSDLAERLVRESIQNSLDAARGDGPVRVRFAFSGEDGALSAEQAERYLDGLKEHLEVVALSDFENEGEDAAVYHAYDLIDKCDPMTYLVVEDLGTEGLTGDVESNTEFEEGNRFWGFFRSVGISPNVGGTGGSWGLGKWVFPDASRINAYLGITRRSNEQHHLLMGMAILTTHHDSEGHKYPPYGQFAARSASKDADWLPMPVSSDEDPEGFISTAIRDFSLQRTDGSGLSVVIPWPKDELKPSDIGRAVLTQYFLPIVHGALEVEIVADGETYRINRDSVDEAAAHIGESDRDDESAESLIKAIKLARWASTTTESSLIDIKATTRGGILEGQDIESLRERFDRGERLAFRLSTQVTDRKKGKKTEEAFRVYLEHDSDLAHGHDYFVRGHLRIPHMDHIRSYHARALMLVDRASRLGDLLRDAEGPAHVSWDPHAERLKKRWIGGYERVQQVRRAAPLLLAPLAEPPRERLKNLLADLFPAPKGNSPSDGGSRPPQPPGPILPSYRDPIAIGDLKDGFSVRSDSANPASEQLAGTAWRLAFAYDVARGGQRAAFNSFRQGIKQGTPDFNLFGGLIRIACDGCRYSIVSENEIQIEVLENEFHLNVRGLDARDVIVDLHRRAGDDSPDTEDGDE